jgi:hypothetical protein
MQLFFSKVVIRNCEKFSFDRRQTANGDFSQLLFAMLLLRDEFGIGSFPTPSPTPIAILIVIPFHLS